MIPQYSLCRNLNDDNKDEAYLYLGEVPNMSGKTFSHHALIKLSSSKVTIAHPESIEVLDDDET